jgi:hypothetical protein
MRTAAVFLGIEKASDGTWHFGLLYNLSEMQFSISLIKLIAFFLANRQFKVSVEGEYFRQENTVRGATRFRPCPGTVQLIHK